MRCVLCVLILCLTFWSGHGLPSSAPQTPDHRKTGKQALRVSVPLWFMVDAGGGARHTAPLLEQVELLEGPMHDGFGVQTHPLLQDGGIQASEVVGELEVSIRLLCRC